jgi:hypothetical protein
MLAERFNARYAVGTTKRPLIRQQIEENVWRILASIAETHIERSLRDALSDCSYRALKCPANMHCRYATGRNCFVGRGISGNETAAESRVLRVGNWNNTSNNLQSSNHNNNTPTNENNNNRFRAAGSWLRAPAMVFADTPYCGGQNFMGRMPHGTAPCSGTTGRSSAPLRDPGFRAAGE